MTTRTMIELAKAVMLDLGLIDASADPSAEDSAYVRARYQDLMAELRDDRLVYWEDDAIPREAFEAVVKLMGLTVGTAFGLAYPSGNDFERELEVAKRRLRRRVVKRSADVDLPVTDF